MSYDDTGLDQGGYDLRKSNKKSKNPVKVGESVMVRSVTFFYVGRIVEILAGYLVLEEASCIFDTGRWAQALATGTLNEVEPYPDAVAIATGAVVDVCQWPHALPRQVK